MAWTGIKIAFCACAQTTCSVAALPMGSGVLFMAPSFKLTWICTTFTPRTAVRLGAICETLPVKGLAGSDVKVTVVATGDGSIVSLKIDPKVIVPADKDLLEDMVLAAVDGAIRKRQAN